MNKIKDKKELTPNGYLLATDIAIHCTGVFPYLGSELGLNNNDVYMVYRPASELEKAIDSYKLIPLIDEHEYLGTDGMAPEKKGIHGTTGEQIVFDGKYLRATLMIYSEQLQKLIERGKIELSPGYQSSIEWESGEFEGEHYDCVQRNIFANHLALVDQGRSGSEVAIKDSFQLINEVNMRKKIKDEAETVVSEEEVKEAVQEAIEEVAAEVAEQVVETVVEEEPAVLDEELFTPEQIDFIKNLIKEANPMVDGADEEEEVKPEEEEVKQADTISKVILQIENRDALASSLAPVLGRFSTKGMLSDRDVAKYAAKKLGLVCDSGNEVAIVKGYLVGLNKNKVQDNNVNAPLSKRLYNLSK